MAASSLTLPNMAIVKTNVYFKLQTQISKFDDSNRDTIQAHVCQNSNCWLKKGYVMPESVQ